MHLDKKKQKNKQNTSENVVKIPLSWILSPFTPGTVIQHQKIT